MCVLRASAPFIASALSFRNPVSILTFLGHCVEKMSARRASIHTLMTFETQQKSGLKKAAKNLVKLGEFMIL